MKRRTLLTILSLALALLLAACKQEPMSEGERELILRAGDLTAAYGFEYPDAARYERFNKTRYFDGSYDLEYEFEPPDDSPQDIALYINVTVTFEKNKRDAKLAQGLEKFGFNAVMGLEGVKMEERKDFFRYGDESAFYDLLSKNGQPGGNYFVAREGAKIYSVFIAGLHFEDPEAWAELITPKLQKFSAHKP